MKKKIKKIDENIKDKIEALPEQNVIIDEEQLPEETLPELVQEEKYIDLTPKKGFLANLFEKRKLEKQRKSILKEQKQEKKQLIKQKAKEEKKVKRLKIVFEKEEKPKETIIKPLIQPIKETLDPEKVKITNEGLPSKLERLEQKLDILAGIENEKKEIKEFKLPGKVRRALKKLAIKNKILVLLLTTNRGIIPMITDIINGYVVIKGIPRNCSTDFVFLWKGKYPAIVIPEWDLNPIGTKDYYEAVKDKRVADPIASVIRMLQDQDKLTKKSFSVGIWIWVAIAVIAVIWIIMGGGSK